MPIYHLYVKTHVITGLKYLGFTSKNPFQYKGSGKYWRRHLRKYGENISTEILLVTESFIEMKQTGLFFSKLWNVVESEEWANLKEESGDGNSSDTSRKLALKRSKEGTHNFSGSLFMTEKHKANPHLTDHMRGKVLVISKNLETKRIPKDEYRKLTDDYYVHITSKEGKKRNQLRKLVA